MKNAEMAVNAAVLAKIMIDTIRTGNATFRNYKFRSEKVLLKKVVASGANSIFELDCAGLNCLKNAGITTLSQIICMSDAEIKDIKGIGIKKAKDIIQELDKIREPLCIAILSGSEVDLSVVKRFKSDLPSVYDIIMKLSNIRQREILEARFAGMKLEDIATVFELTRERIRQIQEKGIERAREIAKTEYGGCEFAEDKYKNFFIEYKTGKEFWNTFSEAGDKIYGYLDAVYGYGSGKKSLEEALTNNGVSSELKTAVERYINQDKLIVDGVAVSATRNGIEEYLLDKYCKTPISIQAFMEKYNDFLINNGLDGKLSLVTTSDERNYAARLERRDNILWLGSNRFRVYDFARKDFGNLLNALPLHRYIDTEVSAAVFFKNYPALMAEFDIRDEYELHYILKAIVDKKEYCNIRFRRTPMIAFGSSDREYTVFKAMVKMAPVAKSDLIKELSRETGVNEATINTNWLNGISQYYHNGMYSFDMRKYEFLYKKDA